MSSRRFLLVLDVNGTLLERLNTSEKHMHTIAHDGKVLNKRVYLRPYLDYFLSQLCNHFAVAVWTSAQDKTASVFHKLLFPGDEAYPAKDSFGRDPQQFSRKLVFLYNRTHCRLKDSGKKQKSFKHLSTFWQSEMNVGKVWSNVSLSSFLFIYSDQSPRLIHYHIAHH